LEVVRRPAPDHDRVAFRRYGRHDFPSHVHGAGSRPPGIPEASTARQLTSSLRPFQGHACNSHGRDPQRHEAPCVDAASCMCDGLRVPWDQWPSRALFLWACVTLSDVPATASFSPTALQRLRAQALFS
jgi:hypothetical protein